MGSRWSGASIRVKFIAAILATVLPVVAIGFGVLAASEVRSLRRALREETFTMALLVGANSAADLAFDAREESRAALATLDENPGVESAALYDVDGLLFSSWQRTGAAAPPSALAPAPAASIRLEEDHVEAIQPVSHLGTRYGTVRIVVSDARLRERTRDYILTLAGLGAALVSLTVLLASILQGGLSRPIRELAIVANRIRTQEDYSVRTVARGGAEIEALAGGVNAMLAAIEERRHQRDRAEASQRRSARRLAALRQVDTAILESRPPGEVAGDALRHIVAATRSVWAAVVDIEPGARKARVLSAQPALDMTAAPSIATAEQHATFFQLLVSRQTVPAEECAPEMPAFLDAARVAGAQQLLPIPLKAREELLGCIILGLAEEPPREEMDFVLELADLVAMSILHARLSARVERHTAELECRVAERTAKLAESVRELESFGYTVAHDLRAPLRAIHGYGSAVLQDAGPTLPEPSRAHLSNILGAAERMDRLIQDLLAYTRMGLVTIEVGPVSLSAVISEAQAELAKAMRGRQAEVVVVEPLAEARGHHGTLVQVATNLLLNAATFTRAGERPQIRIWTEERGEVVRLCVEDTGLGIAPEHQERIFRVFERLHRTAEFPGTGIGLAIVKRGAERCGGTAGVSSKLGLGSMFWIDLPSRRP
ncbi:MAG: ATP-binding protein [Pseudomonadota bacterium]|nr:ATP-binding protein [Pseudomonadota bacterium]